MEYTQDQIKNRFDKLPSDIKEALESIDTTNVIADIGKKNDLHVDQIGDLVEGVGLLMLGLESSNRFADRIKEKLNISAEQTERIVAEINQTVLLKFRDSIRKIHKDHSQEDSLEDNLRPAEMKKPWEEEGYDHKNLERNSLLDEIENPEKIMDGNREEGSFSQDQSQDINTVKNTGESLGYINPTVDLETQELNPIEPITPSEETTPISVEKKENIETIDNIVESKLTGVTKMPTQEKEINIDPYREPVEL